MAFNANLGYNPWGFDYLGLHVLAKRSKSRGLLESFNPGPCIDFSIDGNPQPEDMKNFSCFPWLIGEWKHAGEIPTPTRGHCQAANAAAVALSIMASVAAKGKERPDVNDIWPVFAITSTGHRAKVWIAYISKVERSQYRYVGFPSIAFTVRT